MSRALDPETVAALEKETPQQVYDDIAAALSQDTTELLEFEFLGKSHPLPPGCNVLVDGNGVAVSKSKLVQAFIIARQLLFKYLQKVEDAKQEDVRKATAVVLLMDSEHLTAANTRKRLIQRCQKDSESDLEKVLDLELHWVESMLTSRLHRHTKSPTLWGHRRWVVEVCQSINKPSDIHKDLNSVVLISAERHPRNYYAWLHMRWLVNGFLSSSTSLSTNYSRLISTTLDWCLKHPADTSGFSFLLFCLSNRSGDMLQLEVASNTCRDVLKLTNSFQWTHESVWVFLRTLVASGAVAGHQKKNVFAVIETLLHAQSDGSKAQLVLKAAQDWCRGFGEES